MNCKSKKLLAVILTVAMSFCLLFAFGAVSANADETPKYAFSMDEGAAVKVNFDNSKVEDVENAIRFTSRISKSEVETLLKSSNVAVKTIIVKSEDLSALNGADLTRDNLEANGVKYQQVIFNESSKNLTANATDTEYVLQACLFNFKDENFAKELTAISYLEIDGEIVQYTGTTTGSLWGVADAHRAALDANNDGVVDNESQYSEEFEYVKTLCKTYTVTVNSEDKSQTLTLKHGEKIDLNSLSNFIVEGNTYVDALLNGEEEFNSIVTSDLTLTAQLSVLSFGFDATNDCYYVADNSTFKGDTVIVPATYNDGTNGEKAVEYVADNAFLENANIKKVMLNESVVVVGRHAFSNCTSLTYVSMPGVISVSCETNDGYGAGYEQIEKFGADMQKRVGTFNNAPIETLIVPDGFNVRGAQFHLSSKERTIRAYSLATTPMAWTGDRAANCILRSDSGNGNIAFIDTADEGKASPVYYYSEDYPSVVYSDYVFWHYDEDGEIDIWTEYINNVDAQGIAYGYDEEKECYYVDNDNLLKVTEVVIPATYTDGKHGEKVVKYVADNAFQGNSTMQKLILDKNVIVVGRSSFVNCTALTYLSMPGVKYVSPENHSPYTDGYEKITKGGTNTFLNVPLQTLIVPDGFDVRENQFNAQQGKPTRITRVYSLATTPMAWTGDRADNCKIRSGDSTNPLFINTLDEGKTSPIYYYSEEIPSGAYSNYVFWRYDDNGEIVIWDKYYNNVDEQGVIYGWDADDSCYYVYYSPSVTKENVVIPEKFNDGLHGEAYVKYLASIRVGGSDVGAFTGNTNIKTVSLPESVVSINGDAFAGCTNLVSVSMPGVKKLMFGQVNRGYSGDLPTFTATGYDADGSDLSFFGLNSMYGMYKGYNFEGCTSLQYIVVGDGFQDLSKTGANGGRYNFDNTVNINVFVNGTNTATTQADNTGTFNVYYLSVETPTESGNYWHYVDGVPTVWTEE